MYSTADLKKVNQFIENLHLPEKFGISGDDCYEQEFEDELNNLFYDVDAPFDFHVNYGASKVAIVSEELPFVIKIPFNGMWYVREGTEILSIPSDKQVRAAVINDEAKK